MGWTTRIQFPIGEVVGFFPSPPGPDQLWGLSIQWVLGLLLCGVKQPECYGNHSFSSSA